jgi:hypothetical protein
MELIEDKFDEQGRIFTDGAGKISGSALREVRRERFCREIDSVCFFVLVRR